MKKRTKGILAFAFLGGIMVTSGVTIAIPGMAPEGENEERTIVGTPADNYFDADRPKFCGANEPKSTNYVREFAIPTECTNPLAIVADYDGNIWFAQTNTGKLGKFDPATETFTEYDNPSWPKGARSMIWGIDYAPDGSVWFTDEVYDSVWRFSTIDETYDQLSYPSEGNSLPQKLLVDGSQIIINDFTGNKITFLDPSQSDEDVIYVALPSPIGNSVTSDFALDDDKNVWYTNWLLRQSGILVKFDYPAYLENVAASGEQFLPLLDYVETFELPPELLTPNGIEVDDKGKVWLADTSSSSFFKFDPVMESFTQYVTAAPVLSTFGNQTGIVKSPISRPYWMGLDDSGRIVFNSQTANNISVMDPRTDSLVEYLVPSKNPHWSDCNPGTGLIPEDCGIAQVFDFTTVGSKIWFTEWAENNIGVVDTAVSLPADIDLESTSVALERGNSTQFNFTVSPKSQQDLMGVQLLLLPTRDFIDVELLTHNSTSVFQLDSGVPLPVYADISVSKDATPGTYKVLVGLQTTDVAISKFVTVTIE